MDLSSLFSRVDYLGELKMEVSRENLLRSKEHLGYSDLG